MSSSPPLTSPVPPPPPSQETFERIFNLQRRVEPDRENHITSSYGVLDININNNTLGLGNNSNSKLKIYPSRRSKKLLGKTRNTTAQSNSVYKRNITCFRPAGTGNNLEDHNLALSPTTAAAAATPQENYPLARNSIAILSNNNNSRVKNQLPGNFFPYPSIPKPSRSSSSSSCSIYYSHSLLQPICKSLITRKKTFFHLNKTHRCTSYSWTRKQVQVVLPPPPTTTGEQTSVKAKDFFEHEIGRSRREEIFVLLSTRKKKNHNTQNIVKKAC